MESLRPMRASLLYIGLAAGLLAITLAGGAAAVPEYGGAFYPIPIALYIARRRVLEAAGLVACAAIAAAVIMDDPASALAFTLYAASGVPLGLGLKSAWTYGWTLAATAGWSAAAKLIDIGAHWDLWLAKRRAGLDQLVVLFNNWAARDNASEADVANAQAAIAMLNMMRDEWASLAIGTVVASSLLFTCMFISIATWMLRRFWHEPGLRSGFRDMRPPDWLIWPAIATALLVLLNREWPNGAVQAVSWNAGLVLALVYWLNGLSLFAYVFFALQSPVLIALAVLAVSVYLVTSNFPLVCLVGVFDTWAGFRARLDRWLAARQSAGPDSSDDQF